MKRWKKRKRKGNETERIVSIHIIPPPPPPSSPTELNLHSSKKSLRSCLGSMSELYCNQCEVRIHFCLLLPGFLFFICWSSLSGFEQEYKAMQHHREEPLCANILQSFCKLLSPNSPYLFTCILIQTRSGTPCPTMSNQRYKSPSFPPSLNQILYSPSSRKEVQASYRTASNFQPIVNIQSTNG